MNHPRVASHYQGSRGDAYLAQTEPLMAFSAELNRALFAPHVTPDDVVVDFGCGAGQLLAGMNVKERIGIEINEPARLAAEARGLRSVRASGDLEDGIADVVISYHALEHTLAPHAELLGLHRILKPAGRLVLWVPAEDWRAERRTRDLEHHLYTWTPRLLSNLLVEAGFEVRACHLVNYAWPGHFYEELYQALPRPAFDLLARIVAVTRRRRQLAAVAVRSAAG